MASSSANRGPSTVEEIFNDFKLRRTALITALTTKVVDFERICQEQSASGSPYYLYGRSDGQWIVPAPNAVPSDLPLPTALDLPVDLDDHVSWLLDVAVHSDSWLLAMIGYYTARLSRVERMTVMCLTCTMETVYEMVASYHHGDADASPYTADVGLTALVNAAAAVDHPTAPAAGATALTAAPLTVGATAPLTTDPDVGLTALADAAAAIDHPTARTARTAGATALTAAPLTVGASATACHSCHKSHPLLPRSTAWIECDKCDAWYHELCTGLSVAQLKIARSKAFICSECQSGSV